MSIPEIDQPPAAPNRATGGTQFNKDASAFVAWFPVFVAQMVAMVSYIKEQADHALAAAHLAGLPTLSAYVGQMVKVSGSGALTFIRYATAGEARAGTHNGYLMTPLRTAQAIDERFEEREPEVRIWDHGLSGDLTEMHWTGLSEFSRVRLDFINVELSSDDVVREFTLSNAAGTKQLTSGYVVSTYDDESGKQGTEAIRIHDQTSAFSHIGYIEFHNLNNSGVPTTFDGIIHKAKIVGFHNSTAKHDVIRLSLGGATLTGGSIFMTGYR